MTSLILRKVRGREKLVPAVRKVISEGVLGLERVPVICPACGQHVEAVATDGRVKGYCAVDKQDVDFLIETQPVPTGKDPIAEMRAKVSASIKKRWQNPKYRAKQVATHTGKHLTAETKAKISTALTKKWAGEFEPPAPLICPASSPYQGEGALCSTLLVV